MSGPPTILSLLVDSKKHAVNHAEQATRARASIATIKGSAFHTSSPKHTWIIDLSAMDDMTFYPDQLITHKPSTQSVVFNANGTPSLVVGDGSLSLYNFINLDSVLVVPSLDHNLLSVAQLTTSLGCRVIFLPNHCIFYDILIMKMIGCGTRQGKLYYLD
ncbi:unnamed protein product [Prunus armeniaca]